jgi:hypothetical protein
MQPLPFFAVKQTIQQEIFANPQAPAAHFRFQSAVQLLQTRLSQIRIPQAGKPRIELRICCAKITARRNHFECASE